ncbi:hypothetical protein HKX48_003388 [Thoreauomyces humboldtii]|nr:hypothetical protein HKX48_003388 [Thoreauomyces humboldtii]
MKTARNWLRFVFVYVLIMFADSLNKLLRKDTPGNVREGTVDYMSSGHGDTSYQKSRVFYEQRNLYLTGAVLFLSLLLNRYIALITELVSIETKAEALKSQAAKQSTDYLVESWPWQGLRILVRGNSWGFFHMLQRLLDKDQAQKEAATGHATEVAALKKEISDLRSRSGEIDIVKKQAKANNDAFMDLTDRYVQLERRLANAGGGSGDGRKDR